MLVILLALVGSLMLPLAGCGSSSKDLKKGDTAKPSQGESQKEFTVRLGDITGADTLVGFYLALEKGYFKEEGINIDKKLYINGPNLMMSMANGELDMNIATGFTPMLQAAAQGADIKILASMSKGNAPVIAGPHIKTFKDLDGKVVGTPGLGTIQNTMLSLAAKEYGIQFKKVIHGKMTDLAVFLEKGEIDGFTGWEWLAADTVHKVKGAHYVLEQPVIKDAESVGMGVRGEFYKQHPDIVKKFMRAYLKGLKYFIEHRDEGIELCAKRINRPKEVVEMSFKTSSTDNPLINTSDVKFQVQDAIDTGKIKKEVVPNIDEFINKYIDQSVLREAAKEVGFKLGN